jgi:hypothetical protein
MNRLQFWVLTWSIIVVGPLFISEIFLSRLVREDERKVVLLQGLAQEGGTYSNRWQQLATRVYQMSQQDAALREILVRQHITITPRAANNVAAPSTQESPSAQAPASVPAGKPSQ